MDLGLEQSSMDSSELINHREILATNADSEFRRLLIGQKHLHERPVGPFVTTCNATYK